MSAGTRVSGCLTVQVFLDVPACLQVPSSDVLEDFVDGMTEVRGAVSVGRSVVKDKLRAVTVLPLPAVLAGQVAPLGDLPVPLHPPLAS